jgi:hypothetical protein
VAHPLLKRWLRHNVRFPQAMKVYLIFVFLLAAPALVRLVSTEAPTAAEAPAATPALPEKSAAPAAKMPAAVIPSKPVETVKKPAAEPPPLSQSVPRGHAFYFM